MGRTDQNVFSLKSGRYLLYLDILGFKQLVKSKPVETVYAVLDKVVREFSFREDRIKDFKTIMFSDTILFFQAEPKWGRWAFLDVYAIGAMAWSALAAAEIPCRGTIVFGDFHVRQDSGGRHSLYFGDALIEAYEADKSLANHDWIGISLCPSAWKAMSYMDNTVVDMLVAERRFKPDGDIMRLNPLTKLESVWQSTQYEQIDDLSKWNAPEFPNDVMSLDFILRTAKELAAKKDKSSVAQKYQFTAQLLREMHDEECIDWALALAESWRTPRHD